MYVCVLNPIQERLDPPELPGPDVMPRFLPVAPVDAPSAKNVLIYLICWISLIVLIWHFSYYLPLTLWIAAATGYDL